MGSPWMWTSGSPRSSTGTRPATLCTGRSSGPRRSSARRPPRSARSSEEPEPLRWLYRGVVIAGGGDEALFVAGPLASAGVEELDLDRFGGVVGGQPLARRGAL